MADIVTTKSTLSLEAEFKDGDTRTITRDNPKSGLTAAQINNTSSAAAAVLVGDKTGAEFLRWKSAKITEGTTTHYDLND